MITPATDAPVNVQQNDYKPSTNDLRSFDRSDIAQIIKTFFLRQLVKKEVQENEQQQILTDVTLYDLSNDQKLYGHNEDTEHFAASINKLPVTLLLMEEIEAGHISLGSTLSWVPSDQRGGNGVFDQPGAPTQATVEEVLHDLLNRSGNTAVRIIVNYVLGGSYAVNDRLAAKPELTHTRLIPLDANRFYLGNTTSRESLWVLRQILADDSNHAQVIKEFLRTNIFVNDGVRSQLAGNDYITLINKTGLLYDPDGNNSHDVGVIYNTKTGKSYGYSVLTTAPSASETATIRADQSIKNIGKYFLRYAGDKPVEQTQNAQPRALVAPTPEAKILY